MFRFNSILTGDYFGVYGTIDKGFELEMIMLLYIYVGRIYLQVEMIEKAKKYS